jgi:hypothetical protein
MCRRWPGEYSIRLVECASTNRRIAEVQRRTLRVLVGSQILNGARLAAGITVGALLAQDMLGSTGLAGLPSALFTAGSALAAVAVGRISQADGWRPDLAIGYLTGTAEGPELSPPQFSTVLP